MADALEINESGVKHGQLVQTEQTPGFALVCARVAADIDELERQILDIKTPDATAIELRRVRARLLELSPSAVMKTLKAKFAAKASTPSSAE